VAEQRRAAAAGQPRGQRIGLGNVGVAGLRRGRGGRRQRERRMGERAAVEQASDSAVRRTGDHLPGLDGPEPVAVEDANDAHAVGRPAPQGGAQLAQSGGGHDLKG
jgi:hypothetical protein